MGNLTGWVALFFSSTFFTGFIPGLLHPRLKGKGGGLMGSIVAALLLWALWDVSKLTLLIITVVVSSRLSVWVVHKGEALMFTTWGPRRRRTGEEVTSDYNETNIDEVAGMFWAALIIWPLRSTSVWPLVAIFVLFRILDTVKPWPISWFEKYWKHTNPPFSVMIDDIVAGGIAGFVVGLFMYFYPGLL